MSIEGSDLLIGFVTEALSRIRSGSQGWYDYVISGADRIIEDERHYTAAALTSQRTILVAPYRRHIITLDHDFNFTNMMSKLVHEACHIHRHAAGFEYTGYTKVKEELACIQQEKDMLREIVPPHLQGVHGDVGIQHCDGDLANHPRCETFKGMLARERQDG